MEYQGRIVRVYTDLVGAKLYVAAAIGETTLQITSASSFDEQGGEVLILGEIYTYSSPTEVSEEYDTIEIAPDLVADIEVGENVQLNPPTEYKVADVKFEGEENYDGDDTKVEISHDLQNTLIEGDRDTGLGEWVVLDDNDGPITIRKVIGQTSMLDGSGVVDLPPIDQWGDDPPSEAPVITMKPFAAGAIQANWDPVDSAQAYLVHASLTSPVPTDGSALQATVAGTRWTSSEINDTQIPLDGSLVYVVVEPINPNGIGPASNEASAAAVSADEFISALFVYAGLIQAGQIDSGSITADIAWVGGSLTIGDPAASHITATPGVGLILYAADGTTPIIELRIDGQPSVFRGKVIADDVSVMNGLILQGDASAIATDAVITLQDSVPNPTSPPSLSALLVNAVWPSVPSGYQERGMYYESSIPTWYQVLYNSSTKISKFRTINPTTGAASALVTLTGDDFNELEYSNGIAKVGGWIFVCERIGGSGGNWIINRYNTGGGWDRQMLGLSFLAENYGCVGIASNGDLLFAADGEEVRTLASPGATTPSSTPTIVYTGLGINPAEKITFVGRGNFDYGAERIVIGTSTGFRVYSIAGTVLTLVDSWSADGSVWGGGWDGSHFSYQQNNGFRKQFSGWKPAAGGTDARWWAQITNAVTTPSELETMASPAASILLPSRRYLQITPAPRDDQTTTDIYYTGYTTDAGAQPARTSMWRQAVSATPIQASSKVTSGINPPAASEFVSGGNPGEIISQSGGFVVRGDGSVEAPRLDRPMQVHHQSADQALTENTIDIITNFAGAGVEIDEGDWSLSAGVFTCGVKGRYHVLGQVAFAALASGVRRAYIYKGSTRVALDGQPASTTGNAVYIQVQAYVDLDVGDTISLRALKTSSPTTALSTIAGDTKIWIKLEGARA